MATYNPGSLRDKRTTSKTKSQVSMRRTDAIAAQFQHLGWRLVGIQESRTPKQVRNTQGFTVFASGSKGAKNENLGVELWVNTRVPYGTSKGAPPFKLTKKAVTVLHTNPRCLVARIVAVGLNLTVAAAHAPRKDASATDRAKFWADLSSLTVRWSVSLLLIDANARVGEIASAAAGG